MALFDRYRKLRDGLRDGKVHSAPKEILPFLSGRLSKTDLPELLIEPADTRELLATIRFAAEKEMKIAVASGLKSLDVRNLEGAMLILTNRLSGSPVFSNAKRTARVDGGLPAESLNVDLTRTGLRWMPLFPVPSGMSLGGMFALGWEGLRNWKHGGTIAHVRSVDWIGYDGSSFSTGFSAISDNQPDLSGLLFGSRGTCGVITSLELDLQPAVESRSAVLFQLPDVHTAVGFLSGLRTMEPQPETVVYWGEVATQIIREGNDNRVDPQTAVMIAVEWADDLSGLPEEWMRYGVLVHDRAAEQLWQDLMRFPRTAARLYPERTTLRMKIPAAAVGELEDAARELGHDANLPVAVWGTVESGNMNVWALQPDNEARTVLRAEELLRKLHEVAIPLEGASALGTSFPAEMRGAANDSSPIAAIREKLTARCDPKNLFTPVIPE